MPSGVLDEAAVRSAVEAAGLAISEADLEQYQLTTRPAALDPYETLSQREREVFKLAAEGLVSRRGLALAFLVVALGLTLVGWLRPPLSPTVATTSPPSTRSPAPLNNCSLCAYRLM